MQESKSILHKTYRPAQHCLYANINKYTVFYTYFMCNLNDIKRQFLIKSMVSCNLGESKIFRKTFVQYIQSWVYLYFLNQLHNILK